MIKDRDRVTIEGVRIIYPNFKGREGPFNREGERSFCVVLPEKMARQMHEDGWNVKFPESDDEDDTREPYLNVAVKYDYRPPKVVMISSTSRTFLKEDNVEILDSLDFSTVDLIANASFWEVNGKNGFKAYLRSMYVTLDEDDLDLKYAINKHPAMEGE